jgi:excisionase family DNA binding protein
MALQKRFKKQPTAIPSVISGPRLISAKAAAEYLSMSIDVVRDLIQTRQIPYIPNGRRYLLDRADLDRYVEKMKVGVAA